MGPKGHTPYFLHKPALGAYHKDKAETSHGMWWYKEPAGWVSQELHPDRGR